MFHVSRLVQTVSHEEGERVMGENEREEVRQGVEKKWREEG